MPGDYLISHFDHFGIQIDQFKPDNLHWEMRNCEVGEITYELALSYTGLNRDEFAPKRTNFTLYRTGSPNPIMGGRHTSRNLNKDRDSVLVGGQDWIGWLKERTYPFDPNIYLNGPESDPQHYSHWPKTWPSPRSDPAVDIRDILQDIINAALDVAEYPESPPITMNLPLTGQEERHVIYPGDSQTLFDYIKLFADTTPGFEFDITPLNLEFRIYVPDRDGGQPVYWFQTGLPENIGGQITEFDWTDEGPVATRTLGLGHGTQTKKGFVSTFEASRQTYYWLDKVHDFGQVANQETLNRITASEGLNDRFPAKRLSITIFNPEFLEPNFFTGGRPRTLLGNRVRATHDFGYHKVDAFYKVNAIICDVDGSGNEEVELELEMINEL